MRCPLCGSTEDRVIESRQNVTGSSIRRRRECLSCGYRFTSYETIEEKTLMVIKRDGRREPFDLKKLGRGLQISLEKRPVSQRSIEEMVREIEDEALIKSKNSHEISTTALGEMVLKRLYPVDRVAYVRFASVYRMFENVDEFLREIESLSQEVDKDIEGSSSIPQGLNGNHLLNGKHNGKHNGKRNNVKEDKKE